MATITSEFDCHFLLFGSKHRSTGCKWMNLPVRFSAISGSSNVIKRGRMNADNLGQKWADALFVMTTHLFCERQLVFDWVQGCSSMCALKRMYCIDPVYLCALLQIKAYEFCSYKLSCYLLPGDALHQSAPLLLLYDSCIHVRIIGAVSCRAVSVADLSTAELGYSSLTTSVQFDVAGEVTQICRVLY